MILENGLRCTYTEGVFFDPTFWAIEASASSCGKDQVMRIYEGIVKKTIETKKNIEQVTSYFSIDERGTFENSFGFRRYVAESKNASEAAQPAFAEEQHQFNR